MAEIVEAGELTLWYATRPGVETATELEDVAHLGMIMAPDGGEASRLVVFPDSALPPVLPAVPGLWQRRTAEVLGVNRSIETLLEHVRRLDRPQVVHALAGPVRLAAQARYILYQHERDGHFAYRLSAPDSPGRVQSDLGLRAAADYLVAIRVPGGEPAFGPPQGGLLATIGAELQFGAATVELTEEISRALGHPATVPSADELAQAYGLADEPWRAEPAQTGRWR